MAGSDIVGGEAPQTWILRSYPRVHGAYKVVFRARVALFDPTTSPARRLLQAPLLAWDWQVGRRLRRPGPPPPMVLRLLADAAEVVVAAAVDGAPHAQVNLTVPLAAEAGLRRGLVGALGVPTLHLAAAAVVSRARGRRALLAPFVWPAAAGLAGAGLAHLERRRSAQLAAQHRVELAARTRRAELAGEHALAMGLESAIDALGNVHWLISVGGADPYQDHKRTIAEAARSEATYLADAVLGWASARNRSSPDLRRDVIVTVAEGGSETLLTEAQTRDLTDQLHHLGLTGPVEVRGPRAHICGRRLTVTVAARGRGFSLEIAEDVTAPVPPLDPSPVPLAMMVPWLWFCTHPDYDAVPKGWAAPSTAAAAVAAAVLWRGARRGRPVSREGLVASLLIGLAHVAMTTPRVGNAHTIEGNQPHPWVGALYAPLVLFGLEHGRLSSAGRRTVWAAVGATVGLGFALYPHRVDRFQTVTAVGDVLVAYSAARGWGEANQLQAAELAAVRRAVDDAALAEAFEVGRARIWTFLARGVADARRRLDAAAGHLDAPLRADIEARLRALERTVADGPRRDDG